ncbi:AAA family ATPase [Aeromonas hydrophila]|uniref:AAA family ATPase n=1 Tax=Aeromonas hydrophila TaxID=644 RepID=UPI002B490B2C|nr:AAA family ATPase [Aeromonas hydrophila]
MASSILINQLVVIGVQKNYSVNFHEGVNIIYGDSATGKSSILNLIDYLLGAKTFSLYPEIESSGRYCLLDVTLNSQRYTIKRDLFDALIPIEVYPCAVDLIEQYAARKYNPSFSSSSQYNDMEFYSEFLFTALGYNNVKIKESPTKDDSRLARLSFRDLFKFCYVDQDDLGSKIFLQPENYALQTKNAEVFKYIFNALDSQISDVQQNIATRTQRRNELDRKFKSVSEFLRESDFGSMSTLDSLVDNVDQKILEIEKQILNLNTRLTSDNDLYRALHSTITQITLDKRSLIQRQQENQTKVERFTRLKNDYLIDIAKFRASVSARKSIGDIPEEITLCPICDNNLNVGFAAQRFDMVSIDKINYEINALNRRVKNSELIIGEAKRQWEMDQAKLKDLSEAEIEARVLLDKQTIELSTPYLAERDTFVSKLGELKQNRKELINRLKIRNQHNLLTTTIESLELSLKELNDKLDILKASAPSMEDVFSTLSDHLKEYLLYVKIKNPTGIGYTKGKYLPKVRNIEYSNITSGGLRTIVGIGYLCSLMKEALNSDISYPSFLMIDTVGKYLGKTQKGKSNIDGTSEEDDVREAVSDPEKYKNIYEYIINLSNDYFLKDRVCQFILVDNDVPDHILDKISNFVVAHFSSERVDGLPVGFIDDAVN